LVKALSEQARGLGVVSARRLTDCGRYARAPLHGQTIDETLNSLFGSEDCAADADNLEPHTPDPLERVPVSRALVHGLTVAARRTKARVLIQSDEVLDVNIDRHSLLLPARLGVAMQEKLRDDWVGMTMAEN
jgi:hypothetical protein